MIFFMNGSRIEPHSRIYVVTTGSVGRSVDGRAGSNRVCKAWHSLGRRHSRGRVHRRRESSKQQLACYTRTSQGGVATLHPPPGDCCLPARQRALGCGYWPEPRHQNVRTEHENDTFRWVEFPCGTEKLGTKRGGSGHYHVGVKPRQKT